MVMPPNFVLLDMTLPDVARLVAAMVQAPDRGRDRQGQSTRTQVSRRASAIALKRVEVAGPALLKAARRVMSAAHAPQFGTNEQMFGANEQVPGRGQSDEKAVRQ